MAEDSTSLKVRLGEVVKRIAQIKETQALQALLWVSERKPTPLVERLKLEHEILALQTQRVTLENEIAAERAARPKGVLSYYSDLCGHLVRACQEANRTDLIELAKASLKVEKP